MIEDIFTWEKHRLELLQEAFDPKEMPKSILLLGGINAAGQTLTMYTNWLNENGVESIKSAVLIQSTNSTHESDYFYKMVPIDKTKVKMPWYGKEYID